MSYRLKSIGRIAVVGAIGLAANLFQPTEAAACDPADWYWDTIPQDQETYPANAKPVLQGYGAFDKVTATIDGIDATVSVNNDLSSLFVGVAVDLDPQPQPGQVVVINFPGETGCEMETPCPDQITYTAGELDEIAPAAATIDEVNVVRHNFEEFDSCGGIDGGLAWWLDVSHQADAASAPEVIVVNAYDSENPGVVLATERRSGGADKAKLAWELAAIDNLPALPNSLCFDVQVFDLSGHASTIQEGICDVCHFRDDEPSDEGEPEWTEADIFPGGACGEGPGTETDTDTGETDSDSDTTGETDTGETENPTGGETDGGTSDTASTTEGQNEEGCGCRSTQDAPTAWWLAIFLGLGLRKRRGS